MTCRQKRTAASKADASATSAPHPIGGTLSPPTLLLTCAALPSNRRSYARGDGSCSEGNLYGERPRPAGRLPGSSSQKPTCCDRATNQWLIIPPAGAVHGPNSAIIDPGSPQQHTASPIYHRNPQSMHSLSHTVSLLAARRSPNQLD